MLCTIEVLLDQMDEMLFEMARACMKSLEGANEVFKTGDEETARMVIANDDKIDELERKLQALCLKILLREQPFARDLRRVVSAMKIITDLERIGDQATDIAERSMVKDEYDVSEMELIVQMSEKASEMVVDSIHALLTGDLQLIKSTIEADEIVDDLFDRVKESLESVEPKSEVEKVNALNIIMIAKYLERIADHATNVAEWVEFAITGVHPSYEN